MKQEMELAMKLLEKDIHEKQDTLIGLRNQLDEVKAINVEMYQKMQVEWMATLTPVLATQGWQHLTLSLDWHAVTAQEVFFYVSDVIKL